MAADEILALAADLSSVGPKMVRPMRKVFDDMGQRVADEWANIARTTAGVHGKHYPASIDHDFVGLGIEVEVGPNKAKKQGSMGRGFEFGSVNQPPHLDGIKASEKVAPLFERAAALQIEDLLP